MGLLGWLTAGSGGPSSYLNSPPIPTTPPPTHQPPHVCMQLAEVEKDLRTQKPANLTGC